MDFKRTAATNTYAAFSAAQRRANKLQRVYQAKLAEARQLFPTPLGGWAHPLLNAQRAHYAAAESAAQLAQQRATALHGDWKFQKECQAGFTAAFASA